MIRKGEIRNEVEQRKIREQIRLTEEREREERKYRREEKIKEGRKKGKMWKVRTEEHREC